MSKSQLLRMEDAQAISRLVNECRDLGADPVSWQAHLAQGAARLADASFCMVSEDTAGNVGPIKNLGVSAWGWNNGFKESHWPNLFNKFMEHGPFFNPMFSPYTQRRLLNPGIALSNKDLLNEKQWHGTEYHEGYHRVLGAGPLMYAYSLSNHGLDAGPFFSICRSIGEPDFTARAKKLIQALSLAIADLHGSSLSSFSSPTASDLSSRCRQVLACMLEGDGDKQIAKRLEISKHTVNHYTKLIFNHFHVSSRPGLLALWIQRGWSPVRFPADV